MAADADDELEVEFEPEEFAPPLDITLTDGTCWVSDPDLLHHEESAEGVLAVQYRDGQLFYLDGLTRKWVSAEGDSKTKRAGLRTVQ